MADRVLWIVISLVFMALGIGFAVKADDIGQRAREMFGIGGGFLIVWNRVIGVVMAVIGVACLVGGLAHIGKDF
jgi:hypothetical protein